MLASCLNINRGRIRQKSYSEVYKNVFFQFIFINTLQNCHCVLSEWNEKHVSYKCMPLLTIFKSLLVQKYNFITEMCVSHGIFSNFIYPSTYIVNLPYIFAIVETTKGAVLLSFGIRTTKRAI